jgi:hypothetical protein
VKRGRIVERNKPRATLKKRGRSRPSDAKSSSWIPSPSVKQEINFEDTLTRHIRRFWLSFAVGSTRKFYASLARTSRS